MDTTQTRRNTYGAVCSTHVAAQLLATTDTHIDELRDTGELLAITADNGEHLYPLSQIELHHGHPRIRPDTAAILATARTADVDDTTIARWMSTPNRRLDGHTPWDAAREHPDRVNDAARAQVDAWNGTRT